MGQGLHTKTTQVASRVLGIPIDMINQSELSTAIIANSTTTAASASTDLYGSAVMVCCLRSTEIKQCIDVNDL